MTTRDLVWFYFAPSALLLMAGVVWSFNSHGFKWVSAINFFASGWTAGLGAAQLAHRFKSRR